MEPISGASLGGAVVAESVKTGGNLIQRVLGPSADVLGDALSQYTSRRIANVERIASKAERKSAGQSGIINARVAHRVIEEGSYCDDELMAEYLSGVLASSRSADGQDDLALPWTVAISSMSSVQVGAHFALYRQWALLLHEQDLQIQFGVIRAQARMFVDVEELAHAIGWAEGMDADAFLVHCLGGLARLNLVEPNYKWSPTHTAMQSIAPWESTLEVTMTTAGCELFGWALGRGLLPPLEFLRLGTAGTEDVDMVAIEGAILPGVDELSSIEEVRRKLTRS